MRLKALLIIRCWSKITFRIKQDFKFRRKQNNQLFRENFEALETSPTPKRIDHEVLFSFRKVDLFPSSGEGGGEDIYSVGPLN
jgi:hypothetical protein